MRKLLIALAISLVPSLALAAHVGGGGGHIGGGQMGVAGGHMSGGWSGARMSGSGFSSRAAVGTARIGAWNGTRWNGANWTQGSFHHGRFVHRHGRVFFVGGGPWWVGGYDSCWQWVATPWGLRRAWACSDYGYY
jgi:hypothetical protein